MWRCPANFSDLTWLHPPPTHLFMFLECSNFLPIPGPLFRAPGIISPRFPRCWLPPVQLPASASTPFKRLLCDQAFRMALQSSPLVSRLHFSSEYSSLPNVGWLVVCLTLLHAEHREGRGPVCLLKHSSPRVPTSGQITVGAIILGNEGTDE